MEEYIGCIKLFAGNYAPQDWMLCNGQLLPVNQHQALYAVIGNTYGGSPGSTFALPDLRGRVAVGMGAGNGLTSRPQGQTSGAETSKVTGTGTVLVTPADPKATGAVALPINLQASTVQPQLALNYIICVNGLFPARY